MDRKQLLGGVTMLSLSTLFLRGVGMVYRVVLSERIGAEGMGLYQLIMTVYLLFSMLSSAGLTITVSRLCAERPEAQRSVVGKACGLALAMGLGLCAVLYAGAEGIARHLLADERAADALRWIAPSLPMMGISAALKGFFLARGDVLRPTIAQISEQLARVGLVLTLLFRFDVTGLSSSCSVIFFGATAAEIVSMAMLGAFYLRAGVRTAEALPGGFLLRGCGPIWLGSLMQCGMQTAENLLIPTLLKASGASSAHALSQYGMLGGMVMPFLMFPAAFPAALGTLLLPEIARENAAGHMGRVRRLTQRTLSATLWLSAGFCGVFLLGAQPLMKALYDSEAAGGMLRLLAPLMPLLYLDNIADALLKGLGRQGKTMIVETVDSVLRITGILVLLPKMGMMGYVLVLYASGIVCAAARLGMLFAAAQLPRGALSGLFWPRFGVKNSPHRKDFAS